jgi:hypothetical protein
LKEGKVPLVKKTTIPRSIRPYFFTILEPPDLLEYDAIGFEVENCLVKYNTQAVSKLIIDCLL